MAGAATARLFARSTSVRNAAARLSSGAKTSSFRFSATKPPPSHRIFRSPVELSVCLQPFYSITASPLMLTTSRRSYAIGWLPEGS